MPIQALTETDQQQALVELPDWHVESTPLTNGSAEVRIELVRTFTFRDYTAAIDFLASTTPHINKLDHHPRWESDFKKLTVRTTTHDAGYRLTQRDIKLAKLIDKLYTEQLKS